MARPPEERWTKAPEASPWGSPALRSLSLQAIGLLYALLHGPGNGRTAAGLTLGVYLGLPAELAARLGKTSRAVERVLQELELAGWIAVDPAAGVIAISPLVQPADNASHLARVVNRCRARLADGQATRAYLEALVRQQRSKAHEWTSTQQESVEELLQELDRSYPGLLAAVAQSSGGDGAGHGARHGPRHPARHRADTVPGRVPDTTRDERRRERAEEATEGK